MTNTIGFKNDSLRQSQGHRVASLSIITLVCIGFLLLIPFSGAETLKVISNTDRCIYQQETDKDYCKTVYELCDPALDMNKVDFRFKTERDKSLKMSIDGLSYVYSSEEGKTDCREVTIEGYKNPYKNVDNVLCYDSICHEEYIWWNTSFPNKYPLNCTVSSGQVNVPYLINDSFVIINGSKEILWGNYTCDTINQIVGYLYFKNWTHYALTNAEETDRVSMNIDEGNETDYGNFDPALVGWWHMKDTGNLLGENNYSINCTKNGDPVRKDGQIGHDIKFDGTGDFYNCGDPDEFDFGSDISFTITVWANMSGVLPQMGFINKRNSANADGWFILYQPSTPDILEFGLRGSNGQNGGCVAFAHNDSNYHLYTFVLNRSGDTVNCYIDSVLNDSSDISLVGSVEQNVDFLIGNQVGIGSEYIGHMDEIKVYRRALNIDEILAEYENQKGGFGIMILGPVIRRLNTSVKHFDFDVPSFLITSQSYQTIVNSTFTLIDPLNLVIKGSAGARKQAGGGSTSQISAKIIFNGVTISDGIVRSVRGVNDRGVFTFPMSNVTGKVGINNFILQMKRTLIDDINITNLGFHVDTNITSDDFVIERLLQTVSIDYTSTSYLNIFNFTINKTVDSIVMLDVDHKFESTTNDIAADCYLESFETGERTLTYSRWLQFSGDVGSSGINHRSQNSVFGPETWLMFCKSSKNNQILNNITVYILNMEDNINDTIGGFQNSTSVSGLTGSGNVILSTDYANSEGTQLEILTTIIMQSASGSQDGSDTPIFIVRTNDSVCNSTVERSLTSNSDIGTAKIYTDCGNIVIGIDNNYELVIDVAGGETLNILNASMSSYETTPQLVIPGVVPPIVIIINPSNGSSVSESILIQSNIIDLSRTGWSSIINLINSTGDVVITILNETTLENTTSINFDTELTANGLYTIAWIVSNFIGSNNDTITIIIDNILPTAPPNVVFCLDDVTLFVRETENITTDGVQSIEVTETLISCQYGCDNTTLQNWGYAGCKESELQTALYFFAVIILIVVMIRVLK